MTIHFRPDDPALLADPFPLFARLRDEDPCHWSPHLKAWVVTRYDDVKRVLLDMQYSSDRLRPYFATLPGAEAARIANIIRYLSQWMVFRDPPDHTRLRRLAGRVFDAKAMQAMRPKVEQVTQWLLEQIGEREEFDLIVHFAGPLPALVIMAMLGVPREALARIKRMSDDMALFIGSSRAERDKYEIAEAATQEMADYFRELIAARRIAPHDDLLSQLVHLREGDERLSDDELVGTCILLLFAGHETTTNLIATGLLSLLRFPGELEKLRADPGMARAAVEELLRYDGPAPGQVRIVTVAHQLHGKQLAPGERVFVMLNAANRDPRVYADPERLDLDRNGVAHLAFGFGAHICVGFPLARLEGQVALPALLARWKTIRLASDESRLEWINSIVLRGMQAMPVAVSGH